MGMFDYLKIDKSWLPKEMRVKENEKGWYTKSLNNELHDYEIKKGGELAKYYKEDGYCYERSSYTGEIYFYKGIGPDYISFKAWCYDGTIQFIVQMEKRVDKLCEKPKNLFQALKQ